MDESTAGDNRQMIVEIVISSQLHIVLRLWKNDVFVSVQVLFTVQAALSSD